MPRVVIPGAPAAKNLPWIPPWMCGPMAGAPNAQREPRFQAQPRPGAILGAPAARPEPDVPREVYDRHGIKVPPPKRGIYWVIREDIRQAVLASLGLGRKGRVQSDLAL